MKAFTKDIAELLPTAQLPELWARLRHTLEQRGLMLLTGEPGVGKTAAVRAFCQDLDPTTCTVLHLADPALTTRGLYRLLGASLGLETPWSGSECGSVVRQGLVARCDAAAVPLLVLDEADELPTATLGELRVLQLCRVRGYAERPWKGAEAERPKGRALGIITELQETLASISTALGPSREPGAGAAEIASIRGCRRWGR